MKLFLLKVIKTKIKCLKYFKVFIKLNQTKKLKFYVF